MYYKFFCILLWFIDNRVPKKDFARNSPAYNTTQVRTILPKSRPPWTRLPESRRSCTNATQSIFCCIKYNINVMFLFDYSKGMVILHKAFRCLGLNCSALTRFFSSLVLCGKY